MSYTVSLYHIVFATYRRSQVLDPAIKESFKQYIGGILRNHGNQLLCANYMPDHVHLLINLSVEESLSLVVGTVKQSTSIWLKKDNRCPLFDRWAREYYGVSLSPTHKKDVMTYIQNQENHHNSKSFDDELSQLLSKAGLTRYPDSFYE